MGLCVAGVLVGQTPERSGLQAAEPEKLWVISSRGADTLDHLDCLLYCRKSCRWKPATLQTLLNAQQPGKPLVIWIHGNWITWRNSLRMGQVLADHLAPVAQDPWQMLIWSWPADRCGRPLRDARRNACRADQHAQLLAALLKKLPKQTPVRLVGHSYGARMILAALHQVAISSPQPLPKWRAVLWVPAVEYWAIGPAGRFGLWWEVVEEVLLVTNCRDRVLRGYRCVEKTEALGRVGPGKLPAPAAEKLKHLETAPLVGCKHSWLYLLQIPKVLDTSAQVLLAPAKAPLPMQPDSTH